MRRGKYGIHELVHIHSHTHTHTPTPTHTHTHTHTYIYIYIYANIYAIFRNTNSDLINQTMIKFKFISR